MKKLIVLGIATVTVLLSGCNQDKIKQLETENQTLRSEKQLADSLQGKFYDYLNDIEAGLAEIKSKEKMISKATDEKPQNVQQKILQDLADISTLMDKNRSRMNELENLRRQMKSANMNTEKLQEMIVALEARISEQEEEIKQLQEQLKVANEKIEVLKGENQQISDESAKRQATIDEQTIALNTAYYTVGTSAALKEAGIITQKGGFIGLGKTRILNEGADINKFTKIDIREFKKLETNSEKIEMITQHTADSYKINNSDPKNLVIEITNSTEFWKSSKYLVVRVR